VRTLPVRSPEQGAEVSFMTPFQPNKQSWCGHKLDANRPPRTNCEQCWSFFFIENVPFTQAVAEMILKPNGEETITKLYGTKFLKKAKWFFVAVDNAKKASELINKEIEDEQLVSTNIDLAIGTDTTGIVVVPSPLAETEA
jgi:hypothetical protein